MSQHGLLTIASRLVAQRATLTHTKARLMSYLGVAESTPQLFKNDSNSAKNYNFTLDFFRNSPNITTSTKTKDNIMAKYTVTHSCGHEREYQLYGKHTERDRKLEWLEAQECPACRKAREIERATEGVELPALEGSPKQIAWAESIRAKFVQDIKADKYMDKDDALKTIASCTSAKVFIDERDWGVVNLLNQIKKLTPAPVQEEEPKKEEAPAPEKKSEWGKIAVNVQNVECTTAKGAKINMPHRSDFDGYSVWVSLKLLREGRHSYEYTLSIKADMEFVLKKYGNGKWNKFKVLYEKTISAEEMAEAFGGWIEDAPRMAAPAIDPDREEIIHHEPARLEPVQIEADPELTR